jgi:adenylate cyclase
MVLNPGSSSVRIGINVGAAIVGQLLSGGETGLSVLGDTVNVAARLQSLSEPGAALLSEAAYRLVDGLVEATFAGEHHLKGRSVPERVYRLEAIRGFPFRRVAEAWINGFRRPRPGA